MSWLGVAETWIAASVAAPLLYSWRYRYVKNYRAKALYVRARLHRYHFSQDVTPRR